MSTHTVLEELAATFPDKTLDPLVFVPKGLKIRTSLKACARKAVKQVPHLLTLRRTVLNTLLTRVIISIRAKPGLVGPKFPLLMALASLAKDEIHQYYRHLGKISIRKDCKSLYVYDDYISTLTNSHMSDIGYLLANSVRLINLVREFRVIIINYYSEYISGAYLRTLIPVLQQVSGFYPRIAAVSRPLVEDILHATSFLDLKRTMPAAMSGATDDDAGDGDATRVTPAPANASGGNAERSMAYRPQHLEHTDPLSVERIRADWRDLWFNEMLLNLLDSSTSSSSAADTAAGSMRGATPYASNARTFEGHSIAQSALKVANDIPLVTGDVFRFAAFRSVRAFMYYIYALVSCVVGV